MWGQWTLVLQLASLERLLWTLVACGSTDDLKSKFGRLEPLHPIILSFDHRPLQVGERGENMRTKKLSLPRTRQFQHLILNSILRSARPDRLLFFVPPKNQSAHSIYVDSLKIDAEKTEFKNLIFHCFYTHPDPFQNELRVGVVTFGIKARSGPGAQ
jgi:hypothetical protein